MKAREKRDLVILNSKDCEDINVLSSRSLYNSVKCKV
jgi:hypothetical protein